MVCYGCILWSGQLSTPYWITDSAKPAHVTATLNGT